VIQARAGRARAITQCRGMDSYLPRLINQSESEILNCRGKIIEFLYFDTEMACKISKVSEKNEE
jgi:hypothetical protein